MLAIESSQNFFHQKNIFVALTYKCNAFCQKCITRYNRLRGQSMRVEDSRRLAEWLAENQFSGTLVLGSGESLLYDELPNFVERVLTGSPQSKFRILSNGMAFSSRLPAILFSPRVNWGITLDGFCNEDLKDLQRGVDIEVVKNNIKSVCSAGFADHLYLNYTLNKQNLGSLKAYVDFANSQGVSELYVTELKIFRGFTGLDRYRLSPEDKQSAILIRKYAETLPFKVVRFDSERDVSLPRRCFKRKVGIGPVIDADCQLSFCSGQEDKFLGNVFNPDTLVKWNALFEKLRSEECLSEKWCSRCFSKIDANGYFSVPLSLNPYLQERCLGQ